MITNEAIADEFSRLTREYHEGDEATRPEAWNLLADFAVENAAILTAAFAAMPGPVVKVKPQCCMCGKLGLSTTEGDGGTECELTDGRWVCSWDCWAKAVDPEALTIVTDLASENERLRAAMKKALDALDLYADPRAYVDEDGDLPGGDDHYEGVAAKLAAEEILAALERT